MSISLITTIFLLSVNESSSKVLSNIVAKRLQLQERITNDILEIVSKITNSKDVYVRVKGCHSCVSARGIKKKSYTITKASIGDIKESDLLWKKH